MSVTLQVDGIPQLMDQFALLKNTTQRGVIRKALGAGGEVVRAEAERLAPYDPTDDGKKHLRDNIITKVRVSVTEQAASVGFDKDVYYGQFAETGTSRQPAQPFLRPAIDTKKGEAVEAVADVLREQIEKAVRRKRSLR